MKKVLAIVFLLFLVLAPVFSANAYVSVRGYYRSNGTYVAPYVRSNPNGLKYDNYSWTPSQGLYNPTYGTRDAAWDTPTYITDPNYYAGKSLYESGSSGGSGYSSTYSFSPYVPTTYTSYTYGQVANGFKIGNTIFCNSGYYEQSASCLKAPENSYGLGSTFFCKYGYTKSGNGCVPYSAPSSLGAVTINSGLEIGTKKIINHGYEIGKNVYCDTEYNLVGKKCLSNGAYCESLYGEESYYSSGACHYCQEGYEFDGANKLIASCIPKE